MLGKTYLSLIQYRRPESGSNLLDADMAKFTPESIIVRLLIKSEKCAALLLKLRRRSP